MKKITTKAELENASEKIYKLMKKGEDNLTEAECGRIRELGLMVQEYEHKLYPVQMPKTIAGMVELKMYEKKLTQLQLAKKLKLSEAKLSLIMNGKQKPDVIFLKAIRKELNISADFILDHV